MRSKTWIWFDYLYFALACGLKFVFNVNVKIPGMYAWPSELLIETSKLIFWKTVFVIEYDLETWVCLYVKVDYLYFALAYGLKFVF